MATKTKKVCKEIHLYCRKGTSDKVYEVAIVSAGEAQYEVVARWGRRGGTKREQSKWCGVSGQTARLVAERLVVRKMKRGYECC